MTRDLPGVWIPSSGEPPAKWESARGSSRAVDSRSGDAVSASAVAAAAVCTDRATVSGDGIAVCRVRPLCWGLQSRKEHSGADAASMAALVRLSAAARTLSAYSASFLPPPAPPVPCVPEAPPASVVGNGIAVGIRDRVAFYRSWSPSALFPTVPVTVPGPRSLVTSLTLCGRSRLLGKEEHDTSSIRSTEEKSSVWWRWRAGWLLSRCSWHASWCLPVFVRTKWPTSRRVCSRRSPTARS